MSLPTAQELRVTHCQPCEGGVGPLTHAQAEEYLGVLDRWTLAPDAKELSKQFVMRDFLAAVDFLNAIARVAEEEDHHPDLLLTGYRTLAIHLATHVIKGLSQNDFILAAKIDALPKQLKQ